jgi:hypothetical protein
MRAVSDDVPLLADLMPWCVAPLRPGRSWVMAADPRTLRARWAALAAADEERRAELFAPTRARGPHSRVPQLPGHPGGTGPFADGPGPCPPPVRVRHGAFDQQWLIPDHRLIDVARPELWRVADEHQLFLVESGYVPGPETAQDPAVVASAVLPDGRSPAGRPGRIRPLFRRPGGIEPNVAPGLADWLGRELGLQRPCGAEELAAWITAAGVRGPSGVRVPLPRSSELWAEGVELGRALLDAQTRGARSGTRPKLPGGRRPYVRSPLPARPATLSYDAGQEALLVGDVGRVAPVARGAWEFRVSGVRVLETWFAARTGTPEPGTLAAIAPDGWPQEWTSDLLELVTVLTLLAELRPAQRRLADRLTGPRVIGAAALRTAGLLPPPPAARRPASVLDHHEEGPGGQLPLT